MELIKIEFPSEDEGYLKNLIEKNSDHVNVCCGTARLKKGSKLPFKTLDYNEISYLFSGKLSVYTLEGFKVEMNSGDLIYLHKEEVRETITLEDSLVIYFLFKESKV